MNRNTYHPRRCAAAAIAFAPAVAFAAAGLVLAGCGSSASPAASPSTSPGASASKPGPTASPAQTSAGTTASLADFPIGVGNTWVYQNSMGGTVTNKMTAVTPVSGGQQVAETNTIDLAGSPSTTHATYIFHSDGSITYPPDQFGSGVSVQGGIVLPPPDVIASGQPTTSTLHITVNQSGQQFSATAHITVRGAGGATVTVPAGTYSATIVDMTMATVVKGFAVSLEVRTWLANGVGPVQSEVLTTELGAPHVTDLQKLESFTKG
jgi:hypothetical protein